MRQLPASKQISARRGISVGLTAMLTVAVLVLATVASDFGTIVLVRSQLQSAADAAALAGAPDRALPQDETVRYEVLPGAWHSGRRRFIAPAANPNAVRVTARSAEAYERVSPLFFSWLFERLPFTRRASAVATAAPRDIALVVDLSGSMNDDTEPCRPIRDDLDACESARREQQLQQVYDDFGYGNFPGVTEPLGKPFGVVDDEYAYAALTCNGGPLTGPDVDARYRIHTTDNEAVRKRKAYSAIIDLQIARLMPEAKPRPSSAEHFDYWSRYLDYVVRRMKVGRHGKGGPPLRRGWLPPDQASNRIGRMNSDSVDGSEKGLSSRFGNTIGYLTYVQFMMDHGRDGQPIGGRYVPLSRYSPHCPWNVEETPAGRFRFPPRSQPMHSVRRSLIASLQVIKQRNASLVDSEQRDRVAIVTFDRLTSGGPRIAQPLTCDYDAVMKVCAGLQAVGDNGTSSAVETGILIADAHLRSTREGGQGRRAADKVVVLLTDGMPNLYSSSRTEVEVFIGESQAQGVPNPQLDAADRFAREAPLMQFSRMRTDGWQCNAIGLGMGADHDYVDRLSAGEPALGNRPPLRNLDRVGDGESRSVTSLENILANPRLRIVQ